MPEKDEIIKVFNSMLSLMKPSLMITISTTLLFSGPIGYIFLYVNDVKQNKIYYYILAVASFVIIVFSWVHYFISKYKYKKYKKKSLDDVYKILSSEDEISEK